MRQLVWLKDRLILGLAGLGSCVSGGSGLGLSVGWPFKLSARVALATFMLHRLKASVVLGGLQRACQTSCNVS
jgi:hypothetical protein